ncbi:hypothetical protein BDF14DRAFT_407435 [Spinellus fusiger]|nr:hypothetical protein BDF14DRAFT_407435 [Spinellus fusiger]
MVCHSFPPSCPYLFLFLSLPLPLPVLTSSSSCPYLFLFLSFLLPRLHLVLARPPNFGLKKQKKNKKQNKTKQKNHKTKKTKQKTKKNPKNKKNQKIKKKIKKIKKKPIFCSFLFFSSLLLHSVCACVCALSFLPPFQSFLAFLPLVFCFGALLGHWFGGPLVWWALGGALRYVLWVFSGLTCSWFQ